MLKKAAAAQMDVAAEKLEQGPNSAREPLGAGETQTAYETYSCF